MLYIQYICARHGVIHQENIFSIGVKSDGTLYVDLDASKVSCPVPNCDRELRAVIYQSKED